MKNWTLKSAKFLLLLFVIMGANSCSFDEGKGGSATIKGKVYLEDYNSDGILVAEGYAPDWSVYIQYGEETVVGNENKTAPDGSYEFDFLHVGNYTIYAYSKCNACPNNKEAISKKVTIDSKDEIVEVEDILVLD